MDSDHPRHYHRGAALSGHVRGGLWGDLGSLAGDGRGLFSVSARLRSGLPSGPSLEMEGGF